MIPVCTPKIQGNELKYVTDCIETNWISSMGKYVTKFEEAFSSFCSVKYGVAVSNGTVALHLALASLGIGKGDEVIIPDFTMIAVANAVMYTQAKPVLVDSEMGTWNIDPDKIEEKITERTKAIMPVHTYGHPCFPFDTKITILEKNKIKEKKIGELDICDEVMGYDFQEKNLTFQKILSVSKRPFMGDIIKISLDSGKEIKATPDHPFFVEGNGWIKAKNLNSTHSLCYVRSYDIEGINENLENRRNSDIGKILSEGKDERGNNEKISPIHMATNKEQSPLFKSEEHQSNKIQCNSENKGEKSKATLSEKRGDRVYGRDDRCRRKHNAFKKQEKFFSNDCSLQQQREDNIICEGNRSTSLHNKENKDARISKKEWKKNRRNDSSMDRIQMPPPITNSKTTSCRQTRTMRSSNRILSKKAFRSGRLKIFDEGIGDKGKNKKIEFVRIKKIEKITSKLNVFNLNTEKSNYFADNILVHNCDMDKINSIAKKHKLFVIEDAAEAFGALYKGKEIGSLSDVACFSCYANKIITTGEGGILVTDNKIIADKARLLRNHALDNSVRRFMHEEMGFNYRLTNIQAAIGLAQVEKAKDLIDARINNANMYNSFFFDMEGVIPPPCEGDVKNVYWMYSILIDDAQETARKLKEKGIDTRPFFYPMHMQPMFKKNDERFPDTSGEYPVAEELSRRGLNLPSSPNLTKEEIRIVVEAVKESL